MDFTVGLESPFSYSWYVILASAALLAAGAFLVVFSALRLKKEAKRRVEEEAKKRKIPLPQLKEIYLTKVSEIEQELEEGKLDVRKAYLALSSTVREFVYEATDIHVREFTLTEIRNNDLPALEDLVADYYEPEFAERSKTDTVKTLEKTKRLIQEWK